MKNLIFKTLVIIFLISSCSTENKTILNSDEFKTKNERIENLKKEIISKSEFYDTEFELFNVNGFTKSRNYVPGVTSLDYKFVLKVNPKDVDKWTIGMIKTNLNDSEINWTKKIVEKRINEWKTLSSPEFFSIENKKVLLILYRSEGIIYKRIISE
jgi:arsenate reductase-like glutaredoxin family protein